VQKDRIEVEVVAWGRSKESWSVDYRVIEGDTARPDVWEKLDGILARDWPHTSGQTLPIQVMCVDAGYATQDVYAWVRRHPHASWGPAGAAARQPRTAVAIQGRDQDTALLLSVSRADAGGWRRGLKVWSVGTPVAKGELYRWLKLEWPTDEAIEEGSSYPPGACHFPQYGDEYFKQLTAERLLGEHRLLCGDATAAADMERVLNGQLVDMTFTDPPYNVDYGSSAKDKVRGNKRKILNDNLGTGFEAFLQDACANILGVTKGAVYVCMSSSELHTLQRAFTASGGKWSTFVIWAKSTFTLSRADYQRQYEPILYGWRDGHDHYWCGARDQGDVWFVDKPARNDLHPTMKPVALVERAIRNSSKSRDIVLDPFGGSGSTLVACEKAGRQARLVELDPRYCDVIIQRWQEWTGEQATLEGNGRSYEDIAVERAAAAA
jgi:DNA modification methylase